MDLNHFLLWFVGISCGFLLLRAVRLPLASSLGWIVVCSGILIITAVMFYLAPAISGFVGGSLWAILMLLPLMGMKIVNQLFYQERYAQASKSVVNGAAWRDGSGYATFKALPKY
jgi:rhomboid protease GluP